MLKKVHQSFRSKVSGLWGDPKGSNLVSGLPSKGQLQMVVMTLFSVLCMSIQSGAKESSLPLLQGAPAIDILGQWKYIGFYYEGHLYRPANPNLILTFAFFENKINRLYWETQGEPGFCERLATYEIDENSYIHQEITWVNPKNKAECSRDVDMQLGRRSTTRYEVKENQLSLYLILDGKDFIYLLERI